MNYSIATTRQGYLKATGACMLTGEAYTTAEFSAVGWSAWQKGAFIQEALPELSAEDREFLLTGISPEGWAEEFDEE